MAEKGSKVLKSCQRRKVYQQQRQPRATETVEGMRLRRPGGMQSLRIRRIRMERAAGANERIQMEWEEWRR